MKFKNNLHQRLSGRHFACARSVDFSGKQIIDVGCGIGFLEYLRGEDAGGILGIEFSLSDAKIAAKQCSGMERVIAIYGDFLTQGFVSRAHDIITMFDVIEHFPKDSETKAVQIANESLRPGGRIVISTPLDNATKYFDPAWYRKGDKKHRHYSREDIAELLIDNGFEVEEIYTSGGFWEMFSMFLFYPFKHIFKSEIPFKKFFDKKRMEEYRRKDGYVTLFVVGRKK